MAHLRLKDGTTQEFVLGLEHARAAADAKLSLPQYLRSQTDVGGTLAEVDTEYGDPFDQLLLSSNIIINPDVRAGRRQATVKDFLTPDTKFNMGTILRPDGSQALTIAGKILFQTTLGEMVLSALTEDWSTWSTAFNSIVAITQTIDTPQVNWPIINVTAPRASRSQVIAQLAEPVSMATITTSQASYTLPVNSIGLEISYQAQEATAIDLVGTILRQQAEGERIQNMQDAITNLSNGYADWGLPALTSEKAVSYDASINAQGKITHQAYLLWLTNKWKTMRVTHVICDWPTYFAIETREGRPTQLLDQNKDNRLNVENVVINANLPEQVKYFIVDTSVLGAWTMLGIDASLAIRKVAYAGGTYAAMEEFVLRKATQMMFEYSEGFNRLWPEAFRKLTLTL